MIIGAVATPRLIGRLPIKSASCKACPLKKTTIEAALQGQWALGTATFVRHLETVASRRAQPGQRGRPRKRA